MNLGVLLRETAGNGGCELHLVPGQPTMMLTPSGERRKLGEEQTPESIAAILKPAISPGAAQALSTTGKAQWQVRLGDLGSIAISAERRGEGTRVVCRLSDASGPQPAQSADAASPGASVHAFPPPLGVTDGAPAIEVLFRRMVSVKASDLHLSIGAPPMVRLDGHMTVLDGFPVLDAAEMDRLIMPITPQRNRLEFEARNDTDFAYEIDGLARFRCNLFRDRRGAGGVFRVIPSRIMTAEEMGLSREILELCHLSKGLVLVTGPTGSGKSTTLCALIDYINRNRSDHIITIEDPIEFVHENRSCLINQRQVGEHTDSFKDALRAALREDPDIVLVGEMRDLETVSIAIETAETGHLVFGTLHTSSAATTVDRIIDQYPADRQEQIRVMLASSLKGVISQVLCRRIGGGRVPALEVMFGVPAIANLIREAKVFQIPSIMQTGRKYGMSLMNDSLLELVRSGKVEPREAFGKAVDKAGLLASMRAAGIDTKWSGDA